eukprot:c15758_g1_i1 orf=350-3274(-)
MRSGFLNASPSDSPSLSLDKGSRNKRKFRTDQQQHPAASPLPAPLCAPNGEGSKNGFYIGDACSSAAMDPQSLNGADNGAASPNTIGCCNGAQNFMPSDLINYSSNHPSLVASATVSHYSPQMPDFPSGFQHFPYSKDGQDYAELQQDSDWDRLSEAQLEEILMSALDGVYKDAVKKIASFNFTQEEALSAVLRKGRWNKRDALTSIVESALAWLQNSEARSSTTELVFSDLKELESYVLGEMVCMLKKVRPYLSKGDAMWCLLMCDLNVLLACTTEEDSVPLSVKEGNTPSVVLSQSKQPSDLPLSNALPTTTSTTTVVPSPQQNPCLPQANAQPSNALVSSHKESRSAFSTPSFSSSPVGKVAVASRKGASSKPSAPITAQTSDAATSMEAVSLIQEQAHQSVGAPNPHQLSVPQLPTSEEHATKLGLYISHSNNGQQYLEKCRNWKPEYLVPRVSSSAEASSSYSQETQVAITSMQCVSQRSEVLAKSFGSEQSTSFQPGFTGSKLKGNKIHCSTVLPPNDSKQPVQTDLQIGNTNSFPGFQVPQNEGRMTSNASDNVGSLASSGAELSLATAAIVSSASQEFSGESQVDNCTDDNFVSCTKSGVPIGQMLGCIDSNAEERKTVMLWQLVDRVKYLEAQLQDWNDWAQQKVMQAARRLTKDTAELKALRTERDEYIRLKKEKQALEESTMKKLGEMETSLGKAKNQVERAKLTAARLEAENREVKAEMEAAKLTAAESVFVCQEATKREKKSIKKAQGWEKQKLKLHDELIEGKRCLSGLLEQLSQARERHQQAEVRWRQEKKAKEEAQLHVETEKRAKEVAERSAKRREDNLQRKSEALSQRHRDEVQKLESEIAKVRQSLGLQPSMLSWGNGYKMASSNLDTCSAEKLKQINARLLSEIADLRQSQKDNHRTRECVKCMSEEISVVFLPCAHQVMCVKCNDLHQKKGLRDCPSCRAPIQQRIRVFGVRP